MDRPNIVFVMADQMSGMAMPFQGHKVVRAPALSRLADEGVVFGNAYCNSPLCGPSRTSMTVSYTHLTLPTILLV